VRSRRARVAATWIGLAVTLVLGYFAVRDVQAGEVWEAIRESNPWWLVPAFVAFTAAIFLRAYRWQLLFVEALRPPLGVVWRAVLVGYFFNSVLPARAGEVARVVYLNRRADTSPAHAAATVVIERSYDVLILLLLFFVALPWLPEVSWLQAAATLGLAVALALLVVAAAARKWHGRPVRALLRPLVRRGIVSQERVDDWVELLKYGLAGITRPATAAGVALSTTASWIALSLSNWLLMLGFDLGLSPAAGLLVSVAVGVAMILPASPAALGAFEAATVIALDAYGVPRSEALSYALVLHALNLVPFLVAGPLALRGGSGRLALRGVR
jgi:glycosyltransferase 2 family protein